jgi:hypothetical protein
VEPQCGAHHDEAASDPREAATAMHNDLDRDDWQTLRFSPFWVLSALAGRYREFHPLENDAFWRCLADAASQATGIARASLVSVITDREWVVLDYEHDGRPAGSGLRAAASVLATLPATESAHFKDVLFSQLATEFARARGPFGNTISPEDAETLAIIAALLDVDTDDVEPLSLPTLV